MKHGTSCFIPCMHAAWLGTLTDSWKKKESSCNSGGTSQEVWEGVPKQGAVGFATEGPLLCKKNCAVPRQQQPRPLLQALQQAARPEKCVLPGLCWAPCRQRRGICSSRCQPPDEQPFLSFSWENKTRWASFSLIFIWSSSHTTQYMYCLGMLRPKDNMQSSGGPNLLSICISGWGVQEQFAAKMTEAGPCAVARNFGNPLPQEVGEADY